jgi:hypothetical protein
MTEEEAMAEIEYAYDLLVPWWYGIADYEKLIGEDISQQEWQDFRDFVFENDLAGELVPHVKDWWNQFKGETRGDSNVQNLV